MIACTMGVYKLDSPAGTSMVLLRSGMSTSSNCLHGEVSASGGRTASGDLLSGSEVFLRFSLSLVTAAPFATAPDALGDAVLASDVGIRRLSPRRDRSLSLGTSVGTVSTASCAVFTTDNFRVRSDGEGGGDSGSWGDEAEAGGVDAPACVWSARTGIALLGCASRLVFVRSRPLLTTDGPGGGT